MIRVRFLVLFFYSLALTGCATYHLSTQSLVDQLAATGTEKKKILVPTFPIGFYIDPVTGNDLRTLKCLDKNGQVKTLMVTNQTGIRITKTDSSRTTFYFNTLLLKDSLISGSKTHYFNAHIKPINLRDIAKIEVQK